MEEKATSVEEKIVQAAIECIEQYGIQGTTNRRIAEIAGVNGAAVNYYFRSKDLLMQKVMEVTLKNAFDWQDFDYPEVHTAQEQCKAILNDLLAGAVRYPRMTRAHFFDVVNEGNYDNQTVHKLDEFLRLLVEDIRARGTELDDDELRLAVAQVMSALFLMSLAPGVFSAGLGFDARKEEDRQKFVSRLVEKLLPD
jgi:AcrR family transcriptional regulator